MPSPLDLLIAKQFLGFVIFVAWFPVAATLHELAHGAAALALGDETPKGEGRMVMNPGAHLEIIGGGFFALTGIGWGKPMPLNTFLLARRGGKRGEVAVHLAGPAANLVLALLLGATGRILSPGPGLVRQVLTLGLIVNFMLAVVNLIPVGPLDGLRILVATAPPRRQNVIEFLDKWGFIVMLILILFVLPELIGRLLFLLPF